MRTVADAEQESLAVNARPGSSVVTNGDFSSGGANWDTFGAAVTFSDGMAIASGNNWILSQLGPGGRPICGRSHLPIGPSRFDPDLVRKSRRRHPDATSSPTIHSAVVLGQGDTLLHFNGQGDAMVTDITVSPL